MKYVAKIPFIEDMGTISPLVVSDSFGETKEENALWHINSMRKHDGLEPLEQLPYGVKFTKIKGK